LVDADLRQWQAVTEHLAERRRQHQDRIVGDPGIGSFHFDRERLMDGVGREAQRVIESYDKEREALQIAEGAQAAVAASAALEVGAVGLGALVTILATTVAADVTGVLMASLIAALGLFIIPARRRTAKAELRQKVAALRENLTHALRTHFDAEIQRSLQNINHAISPYTRFVRSERNKMEETQDGLQRIKDELDRLRVAIEET
jgi:methyl-accepting chemotaxis protein